MEVIVLKNAEEISDAVSEIIIQQVKNNPNSVLGLATGSSPLLSYKKVVEKSIKGNIDFKNIVTFNLDEYCDLSENSNQSYRYFMHQNLFKYLNFNEQNHYFPLMDNYLIYDEMIKEKGGIDLQILGIGANGHIAFNEPGTKIDSLTHITNLSPQTIKDNSRFFKCEEDVPRKAITMGIRSILNAKKIILIAIGKNKACAIRELLNEEYNSNCPASALNLKKESVLIFIDEEIKQNL